MAESDKYPDNVFAGRNLKYFIQNNHISVKQLAESFGIEENSVQKILNGTNAISGPYNYILLTEYNCNLNFIYGGVGSTDALIHESLNGEETMKRQMQKALCREMRQLEEMIMKMEL